MWLALGVSFAIYFGGIFVLNFATQSYDNIPSMRAVQHRFGDDLARSADGDGCLDERTGCSGPAATMFTMPNMYFGVFAVLGIAMTPVLAFH